MSIKIACGKNKNDKNGKPYISAWFTEEFLKLFPQFKGLLINMKYIPKEERRSEKSPHWSIELFAPSEQKESEELLEEPEISFE